MAIADHGERRQSTGKGLSRSCDFEGAKQFVHQLGRRHGRVRGGERDFGGRGPGSDECLDHWVGAALGALWKESVDLR